MIVCSNKLALEGSEPMPSDLRRDLFTELLHCVDQDPTSRSTLLGSPAIQILSLECMRLDFGDMLNLAELDNLLDHVKVIEHFGELILRTTLSQEAKQKSLDRIDKARTLYTERVKFIAEHTQSDNLAGIDPSIKLLCQSDVVSLGPGELMTDKIVHNGMDTASKLEDGSTMDNSG